MAIIRNVVAGERPGRPPGPDEWLSDDIWNFISRCWSPSRNARPDVNFVMNALNDAADAVDVRHRKLYATTNDQGTRTPHRVPGASHEYQPWAEINYGDCQALSHQVAKYRGVRKSAIHRSNNSFIIPHQLWELLRLRLHSLQKHLQVPG